MLKDSFSKNSNYYVDLTSLNSKLVIFTPTYEALCNVNNNYVLYCSVTNQRSTNISDICRNFVFINSDISKIHESYRELFSLQETNVYGLGSIGDNSLVCLGYNQNAPSFKYTANLYYYSDIINSDVYIKTSIEVPDSFTNFEVTTFPNRFDNILFFINGEPYLCIDGYSCKKLSEEEALGFFSKDIGHYYLAQRYGDFVISYNYTYEINELKLYKLNADKQTTTFLGNLPHPETTNGILGLVGNELYLTADEEGIYKVSVNDLSIAYYNKYSKLLLPNELHPKIYHLGYSQYLQRYETDTGIYYSLREESIDKCKKEVKLLGCEYKPTNFNKKIAYTSEEIINRRLSQPENKKILEKINALSIKEKLMILSTDLPVSGRLRNVLKFDQSVVIKDVLLKTKAEWLRNPNMGNVTVKELEIVLAKIGLRLGVDYDV